MSSFCFVCKVSGEDGGSIENLGRQQRIDMMGSSIHDILTYPPWYLSQLEQLDVHLPRFGPIGIDIYKPIPIVRSFYLSDISIEAIEYNEYVIQINAQNPVQTVARTRPRWPCQIPTFPKTVWKDRQGMSNHPWNVMRSIKFYSNWGFPATPWQLLWRYAPESHQTQRSRARCSSARGWPDGFAKLEQSPFGKMNRIKLRSKTGSNYIQTM